MVNKLLNWNGQEAAKKKVFIYEKYNREPRQNYKPRRSNPFLTNKT